MDAYSGLAGPAPVFAGVTAVAAFGSLGLPGLSGFIAEFQIFTGSLATAAVATAIAVPGILITAALFLRALQRIFTGPLRLPGGPGTPAALRDLTASEAAGIVPLLALAVVIGVAPRFVLDLIEPAARTLIHLVGR
jgi:NADH-quinone oxidoreductase subunit M